MKRRPFLQQLSLLSSSILAAPMLSFGKQPEQKASTLKFITASDGHWGQPNTDFETSHRNLLEAIHGEKDLDFVVFNGDLIHDEPSLLPEVKQVYDQIQVPVYFTRGNHDRVSRERFQEVMGQATNHAFVAKESHGIILLDASNEKGEYLCADLDFLKSQLEKFASLPQVFVFIHISQREWTRHGIPCQDFMDLIASRPNVRATFHGHDHDVDGQMIYQKKPFLWSGHFGGNWGNPFPSYRVCEVGEGGEASTYLKTVQDGTILNKHSL